MPAVQCVLPPAVHKVATEAVTMWSRMNSVAGNIRSNVSQFAREVQQQLNEEDEGSDADSPQQVMLLLIPNAPASCSTLSNTEHLWLTGLSVAGIRELGSPSRAAEQQGPSTGASEACRQAVGAQGSPGGRAAGRAERRACRQTLQVIAGSLVQACLHLGLRRVACRLQRATADAAAVPQPQEASRRFSEAGTAAAPAALPQAHSNGTVPVQTLSSAPARPSIVQPPARQPVQPAAAPQPAPVSLPQTVLRSLPTASSKPVVAGSDAAREPESAGAVQQPRAPSPAPPQNGHSSRQTGQSSQPEGSRPSADQQHRPGQHAGLSNGAAAADGRLQVQAVTACIQLLNTAASG